jgi:hypothetical protein
MIGSVNVASSILLLFTATQPNLYDSSMKYRAPIDELSSEDEYGDSDDAHCAGQLLSTITNDSSDYSTILPNNSLLTTDDDDDDLPSTLGNLQLLYQSPAK